MATLFNTKIKDTYQSLLKLEDNTILTTTVKNVTDGLGNASPLYMSTTRVGIGTNNPTATLDVNGAVRLQNTLELGGNTTYTGNDYQFFIGGGSRIRFQSGGSMFYTGIGGSATITLRTSTTGSLAGTEFLGNNSPSVSSTVFKFNNSFSGNLGISTIHNFIELNPTGTVGQGSPTLRTLYINPSITGFTKHIAFENTTGDVLLGTTSGNVLIGTTTDSGYKLDVNGTARLGVSGGYVTVTSYTPGATTMSVSNSGHHGATAIFASSAVGINAISVLGAGPSTTLGVGVAARRVVSPLVDTFTDADGVVNSTYKSIGLYAERAIISNSGSAFIMTNGTMLHVDGATVMSGSVTANSIPASPNTAYGLNIKNTLVAAANNDSLVALDINPTFTNGAFTGVNNYNIKTRGLLNKMYFQSPTTNQGRHDISFGFGGSGEQVKLIASAMGGSGEGDLYISLASGDTAVATTSNANALFQTGGTTFFKSFTLSQSALTSGNGLYLSGNQQNSITNGIYFRFSETRVAILSKPNGGSGYADFRIAIVPLGGGSTNNPPQLSDTKFMITQDTTNVLINTTTDSGFKLDVNGSTRVKGNSLTISASGLASPPADYVALNFEGAANHHLNWFAINSRSEPGSPISSGYNRIIFPTMGGNAIWNFNALGGSSSIQVSAVNSTTGNYLTLNDSSISFSGVWNVVSIDRTNRKLIFGNMLTDVNHLTVYDIVIKGAKPNEGNYGGAGANGGNIYIVGGTPATSPAGNYGHVLLAHDGTAARGSVIVGGTTINDSAILNVQSTTKGVLPPRMTTTQKNAIASPATGLQVFDITMNAMCEYNGTAWRVVSAGKQTINATTGATTIDLSAGNVADVTLTLSTVITLTNPTVGTYVIKLIQDAIGGKVVSWPFNVLWSGGTPPTLTATANKTDVITLMYDGVNYYGTYALNF